MNVDLVNLLMGMGFNRSRREGDFMEEWRLVSNLRFGEANEFDVVVTLEIVPIGAATAALCHIQTEQCRYEGIPQEEVNLISAVLADLKKRNVRTNF